MVVGFAPIPADAVAGASITGRDIGFHADDRLDPRFFRSFLELPRPMQVTVIGYGEGGLFELQRSIDEIINAVGAVEKRVFRVAMEVDEGHMIRICDAVSWR